MTEPKTLLELSGASLTPSALSRATLVLIDCQNEYVDGALALPGVGTALDEAARVLTVAREAKAPVIHVRHLGRSGGVFDPEGHSGQIAEIVAPREDEKIIEKMLPNAFAGTDLTAHVHGTARNEIILVGFMTHMCVSSTARAALDLGFRTTIVAGATATRDLPDPYGGVTNAETLQHASLAALSDRFAVIANTAADLPH